MKLTRSAAPMYALNFEVTFFEVRAPRDGKATEADDGAELCSASFSEISGLEATMEPKVIKQGGQNFGEVQRVGPVSFSTVILKRGVTSTRYLWQWFELIGGGMYSKRFTVQVRMLDANRKAKHIFVLERALPVKFKAADFNAQATAVAIEELHLAHEGMSLKQPGAAA